MSSRSTPGGELTSQQVADYLGVKLQSVYAYASRGVLTPLRREPGTGSIYALDDVMALVGASRTGRRRRPASATDDVRTRITEVTPGTLAYRGRSVEGLVGAHTFEEVRALLVDGTLPMPPSPPSAVPWPHAGVRRALRSLMAALPEQAQPLDRFKHAVLVAGATDVGRRDRSATAFRYAGERALACMVLALLGGSRVAGDLDGDHDGGAGGVAAALASYLPACPVDLIDAVLVLLADHDLAVSTTAVRVAVSAGADPYGALLAGLAAADSPVHVGASMQAVDWLAPAMRDPQGALDAALAAGPRAGAPPGFGHLVYTEADPRAQLLLARLEAYAPVAELASLRLLERELMHRCGWVLNVDGALALMVRTFDLPRDAGAVLFACARTAGWAAHAVEELAEPQLRFRLKGIYSGTRTT